MRYGWVGVCVLLGLAACGATDDAAENQKQASQKQAGAVPATAEPTIFVKLDAAGTANMSKLDQPDVLAATGTLRGSPADAADALSTLLAAAKTEVASPSIKEQDDGESNAVLALTIDADTRWQYVQWITQVFAHPAVRIRNIDFHDPRGGTPLRIQLPVDRGIVEELESEGIRLTAPQRPDVGHLRVAVFRRKLDKPASERYTLIRIDNTHMYKLPAGVAAHEDDVYWDTMRKVRDVVEAKRRSNKAERFDFVSPPPKGGRVPYFDVFRILRLARDLGFEAITLEGASTPLPR